MKEKSINKISFDSGDFWVTEDTSIVSNNLAGFKQPDKMVALVNESSTDDGKTYFNNPFRENEVDGSVCILPKEQADILFDKMNAIFNGKKLVRDLSESFGEGVVALWNIDEENSAIFVGENTSSNIVEDVWYETCRANKVPPYESNKSFSSARFNIEKLNKEARESVVQNLKHLVPVPAKKPKMGK